MVETMITQPNELDVLFDGLFERKKEGLLKWDKTT